MRRGSGCRVAACVTVIVVLGCGGSGAAPVATFPASADHLLQDATGLWTPEGEKLSDLKGAPFADLYVVDGTRDAFFLLSDAGGVHVARRTGDAFRVDRVMADGVVERPIGEVALVRLRSEDGGTRRVLVDLDGKVLHEGLFVAPSGGEDPPVDQPEYWWSLDYMRRPVPLCTVAEPTACGWMGPDGAWIREPGSNRVPPMYVVPIHDGGGSLVDADGSEVLPAERGGPHMGPASEGLVLVGVPDPAGSSNEIRTEIRRLDGAVTAVVEGAVVWTGSACAGPRGDGGCQYVFHQGRAAVRMRPSGGGPLDAGYLAPDGAVAIGPDPCEGTAPSGPFHEDRAFHCVGSEYWLVDRDGRRVAGPWPAWKADAEDRNSYPYGLYFSEGLAAVPVEGGWAYVDTSGETVLPGPYEVARPFRLGVAAVVRDGAIRYVDRTGAAVFE